MNSLFILFLLLQPIFVYAHGGKHLGKINFTTSANEKAQPLFESGIMQLHSFEYAEARADFQNAKKADPEFALAYWGEAMTYNHPLWGEQDYEAALKVLNELSPTAQGRVQKAKTVKEKLLINAVNILYGKGSKKFRDNAYADAMREIYRQYPNDDEIASFYALALLGTTETKRDMQVYMQAAGIADEIYSRNPLHPGALHYAIHSFDDPIHAPLGLRAARSYAKIAPDASHALHMPSHIFMAMGMWDDVIASNKAAWEVGLKQNVSGNPQQFTIDDLHALQWLGYGYLQKQQYHTAYQSTKVMEKIAATANTPMAKWYYAMLRAAYVSETHDYNADLKSLDMTNIELSARASNLYTDALIALNQGHGVTDINAAKAILGKLSQSIPKAIRKQDTYQDYFISITDSGITAAKIMELELQAHIASREGKIQDAILFLKKAIKLEDKMSFGYGPPIPVKPASELLAEYNSQHKQYAAAYQEYFVTLKRMPHRFIAEQGLKLTENKLQALGVAVPESIRPYFNRLMLPEFYH